MPLPAGLLAPNGDRTWNKRQRILQLQAGKRIVEMYAKENAGGLHGLVALLSHPRSKMAILVCAIVTDTPLRPTSAAKSQYRQLISYPDGASQAGSRAARCNQLIPSPPGQ